MSRQATLLQREQRRDWTGRKTGQECALETKREEEFGVSASSASQLVYLGSCSKLCPGPHMGRHPKEGV